MTEEVSHKQPISMEYPLPNSADSYLRHSPLPSPRPFGTRRSSSRITSATLTPLTPPLPADGFLNLAASADDGDISQIDPRQVTPSLHASLVSEILSLRRELDTKQGFLDDLDSTLSLAKAENDALQRDLSKSAKESRSNKRQLQILETETLSTVELLCKERDETREANGELRKKIDIGQKRSRTQDEETRSLQSLLEQERARWNIERSQIERKAIVAEGRLKSIVMELAAREEAVAAAKQSGQDSSNNFHDAVLDDAADIHTLNAVPRGHAKQKSSISSITSLTNDRPTLADELQLDQDSESDEDTTMVDSAQYTGEMNSSNGSEDSMRDSDNATFPVHRDGFGAASEDLSEAGIVKRYSASLEKQIRASRMGDPRPASLSSPTAKSKRVSIRREVEQFSDVEANQRRKRDPPRRTAYRHSRTKSEPCPTGIRPASRLSKSSRLSEMSPEIVDSNQAPQESMSFQRNAVSTASTQTEPEEPPQPSNPPPPPPRPTRAAPPLPLSVPAIEIHPPQSAPPSPPTRSVLPPRTKSVGSQTSVQVALRSIAVQTDTIRVDKRFPALTSHYLATNLESSAPRKKIVTIADRDLSPIRELASSHTAANEREQIQPSFAEPASPSGSKGSMIASDEGDLGRWTRLKRALLPSGRAPMSENNDSEVEDDLANLDDSDAELSGHVQTYKLLTRTNQQTRMAKDDANSKPRGGTSGNNRYSGSYDRRRGITKEQRSPERTWQQKGGRLKYAQPLSSNASSINTRTSGPRPPFAIPKRISSQQSPRQSRSDDSMSRASWRHGSRTSPTRGRAQGVLHIQTSSVRRSRSSVELLRDELNGPVPSSPSDPLPPPLPVNNNAHTGATNRHTNYQTYPYNSTGNASVGSSHQLTVVDAITATMIGEWMWKYVRRRKSFVVSDTANEVGKGDVRHKRWVWLSPYDRTILWSTKQPTNNAALLGKAGRKLSIQSVLDVKDDTPASKGVDVRTVFDRSILILTPARALKFTATTRERHYLWLTALSFLAHNTSGDMPNLTLMAPSSTIQSGTSDSRSGRSRTSSILNPLKSRKQNSGSMISSGMATPHTHQSQLATTLITRDDGVPDQAFAPAIPRVPHSRKRSSTGPSRGRSGFGGMSVRSSQANGLSSTTSMLSVDHYSMRAQSQSGASDGYSLREYGEELDAGLRSNSATPRLSVGSADFGGNNNFFDAVGVIGMDAFADPPAKTKSVVIKELSHKKQDSKESFIGPPNIIKARPLRRKANLAKEKTSMPSLKAMTR